MQTEISIQTCRKIWEKANKRRLEYSYTIDNDDLADQQLDVQIKALNMMADIRAPDLERILTKLYTWKEESFPDGICLQMVYPEQLLVISVIEDIKSMLNARGFESGTQVTG